MNPGIGKQKRCTATLRCIFLLTLGKSLAKCFDLGLFCKDSKPFVSVNLSAALRNPRIR